MSSADSKVSAGTSLITYSTLARSQAALRPAARLTFASFFDLCSLLEAVVLLDNVKVMTSADKIPDSGICHRLRQEGVLTEFTIELSAAALSQAIRRLPSPVSSRVLPDHFQDSDQHGLADGRMTFSNFLARRRPELDALVEEIDRVPTYPSAGKGGLRQRVYRSYAYLVAAGLYGWDYFPDYERAPFVADFINEIYRSLPVRLYEKVAASLQATVQPSSLLSEWVLHDTIPIPPISSIILHRSSQLADIPDRLFEVRAEFAGYRHHFADLKTELHEAQSVPARRKIIDKYKRLLGEVSGPRPEAVSLSEVINLAEKAMPIASNPLLPTSYSALLLAQPAEWIRRWWRRRPLTILFRLDGKMPRIDEYRSLITKLWGLESDERATADYSIASAHMRRLMHSFDSEADA